MLFLSLHGHLTHLASDDSVHALQRAATHSVHMLPAVTMHVLTVWLLQSRSGSGMQQELMSVPRVRQATARKSTLGPQHEQHRAPGVCSTW